MSLSQNLVNTNLITHPASIDPIAMSVLKETLYPGAKDESIHMVINYCRARNLDPMLKPVHLVPMSVKTGRKDNNKKDIYERRDVVMPGIALYRILAARTGQFAGLSEAEFGPDVTEKVGSLTVTYPKWCKVTARKMMPNGVIAEFSWKEYWKENYATKSRDDQTPNDMWFKRPYGQLSKCAQSQVLRLAFPEAVGQEYTKEEMEGKTFDHDEIVKNSKEVKKPVNEVMESVDMDDVLLQISQTSTKEELEKVFKKHYKTIVKNKDKESLDILINAKDRKKDSFVEIKEEVKPDELKDISDFFEDDNEASNQIKNDYKI